MSDPGPRRLRQADPGRPGADVCRSTRRPDRPESPRRAIPSSCRPTAAGGRHRRRAASRSSTNERRPAADSPQRVVRLATREDIVARLKHQQREHEAYRIALLKIRERGLGMKLTRVEQAFDGSRLVFYFTADGRVDFRELVRELAAEFRTRIEMRQIGVRDEAKMIGGYGTCGRPLCCTTFLHVVRAGVDQDGEAAGPEPEPVEAVRAVRPAEVLPALRAAERQRRRARRLRQRRRLRQSVRLRHAAAAARRLRIAAAAARCGRI